MKKLVVSLCSVLFASSLLVSASAAQTAPSCVTTQTVPSCITAQLAPSCVSTCMLAVKQALCQNNNTCLTKTTTPTSASTPAKATCPTKPTTPTTPTKPTTPTTPTKPTTPTTPTKPTTPTTPTKPTTPTTPAKPTTPTTPAKPTTPTTPTTPSQTTLSAYEQEVVRLVNDVRAQNGLNPLTANQDLSNVARTKSQDMKDKNYFSHTSPTYGSPFDMMRSFGISYRTAGENIAYGQKTPEEVMNAWMNSSGHRANILNASFTQIGVGYVSSGNYWTQMFIG